MASNLLIANAGIPLDSIATTSSVTANGTQPFTNLFGGNKTDIFRKATSSSGDARITVNVTGSTANFIYLARANLLQQSYVNTITLKAHSSDAYASATTITTLSSFASATLMGPNSDDYLATFTTSSSYAWWFVNYNATSAGYFYHAKLFFGNYFDPGIDPTGTVELTRSRPHGARYRSLYKVKLRWEGLTYAKAVTMYNTYYRNRRHNPVILFTTTYHPLLNSHTVLFGRILEMSFPPRATDYCDVSCIFEEVM